jgi:Family of unknown function (DUF6515)
MSKRQWVTGCSTALLALAMAATAAAGPQEHGGGNEHGGYGHSEHYDTRYSHNQYYPAHGGTVSAVPGRPVVFERPGGRYYYSGGIWYAPHGPNFVVVTAPVGLFVPVLPPYYTTVWIGGFPYYYANDTYYTWNAAQSGYEVVAPPDDTGASTQAPVPPPPAGDQLYVYPQNGQSADQQAADQYECHRWANSQTGFDPTQPSGGVSPDQLASSRADYRRAMIACLQGRGYSAR